MPRSIPIDPAVVRRPGTIVPAPIPVNGYRRPLADVRAEIGDARLVEILRRMIVIRAFESALDDVKRLGRHGEVAYAHRGPAHLSIGQEAAAVGQAEALRVGDHVFGSHRSHGEIIAKGLAAIAELGEADLEAVMADHLGGEALRVLEDHLAAGDVRERAEQFLLYGLLAEVFGRRTGFNRGLGGSMHAFFPPFGIYPNNAIVGGSAPIAAGAALHRRVTGRPGIVVANIGDGAAGSGPVWEAMNFAAMRQFRTLWQDGVRGGLPVLFFFVNNFYAMGGQTLSETMAFDRLARVGAGLNEDNLHAETIDGNDPLAVADAVGRKRRTLEAGDGPVLLDCQCYRQSGHSTSDAASYRTREEIEAWRAVDPILEFGGRLTEAGIIDDAGRAELGRAAAERIGPVFALAADLERSPRLDPVGDPGAIGRFMYSGVERPLEGPMAPDIAERWDRSPRRAQLAARSRHGLDDTGARIPSTRAVTLRVALFEAILDRAGRDPELVVYGQENRDWEGAFGVYQGLTELLPYHRLFNAPISEAAIVGTATGLGIAGGRALVELMYADFIGRAGDELFNQLPKWQAMSGGLLRMPVVVRVSIGSRYGAQHSQDWTALVAHVPGLQVAYPATPFDAKGLMASALAGSDPVVFFESQQLYDMVELFEPGGVPDEPYTLPFGPPDRKRAGTDVTILAVGPALYRAIEAAERLASAHGLEADVLAARTLVPFDAGPLLESVERTGRLLLVSDACIRGSVLNTIAVDVQRVLLDRLAAPIEVLGSPPWITPPAELETAFFPQAAAIISAVERLTTTPARRAG